MSCTMLLIRHGETMWNAEKKLQGHRDVPLSEVGILQAQALAQKLEAHPIDAVYASDLSRAVQTAEALASSRGLKVQSVPELREMNFGLWEGMSYQEIQANYPGQLNAWCKDPLSAKPPDGELVSEMAVRVFEAMKSIVTANENRQVAVVCHGGPIRAFVAMLLGMNLQDNWRIRQDNVALNVIDFPTWEEAVVMLLNDTNHILQMTKS